MLHHPKRYLKYLRYRARVVRKSLFTYYYPLGGLWKFGRFDGPYRSYLIPRHEDGTAFTLTKDKALELAEKYAWRAMMTYSCSCDMCREARKSKRPLAKEIRYTDLQEFETCLTNPDY